jgi:hypothetical protein
LPQIKQPVLSSKSQNLSTSNKFSVLTVKEKPSLTGVSKPSKKAIKEWEITSRKDKGLSKKQRDPKFFMQGRNFISNAQDELSLEASDLSDDENNVYFEDCTGIQFHEPTPPGLSGPGGSLVPPEKHL